MIGVKAVETVLIEYIDENGDKQVQLGFVGDKNVELKNIGITRRNVREGLASNWLRDGLFKFLGKKI